MDKISLEHLEFFAHHGVFEEEKQLGQTFYVSVVLELDLTQSGISDDLEDTVNYGEVYDIVSDITLNNKFNLMEKLAYEIITRIFATFPEVKAVTVRTDKPHAPGKAGKFPATVEMRRERE